MSAPDSAGPRLADAIRDQRRPFVVYWNNIPSPYMVERFNALADRNPFEFEAWFNDRIESDRSWDVDEVAGVSVTATCPLRDCSAAPSTGRCRCWAGGRMCW